MWEKTRTAIAEGKLEGCTAVCSAKRYDPTKHGPGPRTTAKISVYTEKSDMDEIGFKIAKQDIVYKTNELMKLLKTTSMYMLVVEML